jgi:hypothetical protein
MCETLGSIHSTTKTNILKKNEGDRVWWYTPVIPELRRLRQEDHKFKVSLGYIERLSQKKKKRKMG